MDDLMDDDPSLNRRLTDHVTFTRREIDRLNNGVNGNTTAIEDLTERFINHDKEEVQQREAQLMQNMALDESMRGVAKAIQEVSDETRKMRNDFAKYQIAMKPAENGIIWARFTKGIIGWAVAIGGGFVLFKEYGSDLINWLSK